MVRGELLKAQRVYGHRLNAALVLSLLGASFAVTDERSFLPLLRLGTEPPKAFAVITPPGTGAVGGGSDQPARSRPFGANFRRVSAPATRSQNAFASPTGDFANPLGSPQIAPLSSDGVPGIDTTSGPGSTSGGGAGGPDGGLPATNLPGGGGGGFPGATTPPTIPGGALPADPVAAVPEPQTWLTMLFGFGCVGGVARRGKRRRRALA